MELRSGTEVHLSRDYFPANAYRDPYNLYTPLKRPQRIKREAKALNLLNVIGEVREGLRQPEAITHTYSRSRSKSTQCPNDCFCCDCEAMFKRKLQALEFCDPTNFDIQDESQFRSLILWLEDQKIRHYKIEDRAALRNVESEEWTKALHEKQNTTESSNPLDNLDFNDPEFKAGITSLSMMLKIPLHENHLEMLKAICILVSERFSPDAIAAISASSKNEDELIPLDQTALGFEAGENWINEKCKEIQQQRKHAPQTMYRNIEEITRKRTFLSTGCLKVMNGDIIIDKEKILERWAEYIRELFKDDRKDQVMKNNFAGPPIMKEEVETAIKKMKHGKAAGPDNISVELIEAREDFGIGKVTHLLNEIYDTGQIPTDLSKSIFIALPKKSNATECELHRTISLMSHITKILLKIIMLRIRNKIKPKIAEEQCRFVEDKGTSNAIYILRPRSTKR
ncbi:upf0568 protein c14orf166 homolog [Plakobranchus ocellatus]|uniref:Upf0568 protein c14orf166 homolog n=1 Tax=Plakobranchus ocellatus TaxID=259542 RepID=A0AAV4DXD8_9GAST|nr:upf0568 protein c14orf166 homolog [Plakobranchus ocellatus]